MRQCFVSQSTSDFTISHRLLSDTIIKQLFILYSQKKSQVQPCKAFKSELIFFHVL
jgi:hypothetical protein